MDGGGPAKLDLKKQLKHLYLPSAKEVSLVNVPEMKFITVDGKIEPDATPGTSPQFAEAIGVLYGLAYTLKFMSKLRPVDPVDYTVMALEGLWTTPAGGSDYAEFSEWSWTLMIMQPDHITPDMFAQAVSDLRKKRSKDKRTKPGTGAAGGGSLERVRLVGFCEGLCVQIMHIGPYSDEPRTLEKMAAFAESHGYVFSGRHHEIYLGDPRTAKPENLKTVLRHPVVSAG